ncbi:MAG: SpaA isopeptide-forming pilin-related protein, partial [Clostridia bacterium]|nr:SpaA isopeptide-forming pilin-related protein [Clostridia bacterium]
MDLAKSANPAAGAQIVEGQVVTYTVKLGVKDATSGIVVADVIPAGMTFVPGSITTTGVTNGTYNEGTRTITWPEQVIPAGGVTMSFQATVDKFTGVFSKPIENVATATITRANGDSVEPSNQIEHEAVRRQVTVSKDVALVNDAGVAGAFQRGTAAEPIETELGQVVRYRLALASQGYLTQGTITVEDVLHPDVAFVAGSMAVVPASLASKVVLTQAPSSSNGNKAIWTVSNLGEGEGLAIEFEVTAPVGTDDPATPEYETRKVFTNGASLTDDGLKNLAGQGGQPVYSNAAEYTDTSNNTYNVVFESELTGRKFGKPGSPNASGDMVVVEAGDIITYTIEVINVGDKDADKARVLDILPAGVEFVQSLKGPTPVVFEQAGVTTLMWELPNLAHADRATGQPVPAGILELEFTVRVLEPIQAQVLENAAYYRLSGAGEPFPAVSGQPDSIASYRKTGDRVRHQTYMFRVETSPAGGLTAGTATRVQPGDEIVVAQVLQAAAGINGVNAQYTVPQGLAPVTGSIRMVGADGTVTAVPDSAFNPVTRSIQWPQADVTAGETRFEVKLTVDPLTGDDLEQLYASTGNVSLADGNGGVKTATDGPLYHEASVGFSEITKTAALIEDGVALAPDPGTEQAPVRGERGQQVEYTLTVTREAGEKNRSGRIVITDVLPGGMALVAGSVQGTVSGEGQVLSMGGAQAGAAVEWVLQGLADGSVATLVFRGTLPESADDPALPGVQTRREVINTARLVDEALRDMKVYPAAEYDKTSNATYHYILGPSLEAVKRANVAEGSRVGGGAVLTYTVTVRNTGEDAVRNLLVRDRLNSALRYVAGSQTSSIAGAQFVEQGQTIGWIVPELAIGQVVVFTFQARVEHMDWVGLRNIPNVAEVGEGRMGADVRTELLSGNHLQRSNQVRLVQWVGATIIVRKIDASTGARLSGAEFVLRSVNGAVEDMVGISNGDGEVLFEDVPMGRYVVIETKAPEGYTGSDIRRSLDINGQRAERTIVVPNRRHSGTSSDTDFDDEEMSRNWGMLLEMIMDVGVPNAGAASRNVGDAPQ